MEDVIDTEELRGSVGDNLIHLRETKGWTQRELAEKVGVHRVHISRIENGRLLPSIELLFMLADVFGVPADSFRKISLKPS